MSHTKKKMNPILRKELRLGSRSIKIPLALMFYNIVLALIAVVMIFSVNAVGGISGAFSSNGDAIDFSGFLYIFQVIGWTQLGITLLIVPILSAGSISGEREKQTLEIMLTTPEKPFSIIWGKLLASLSNFIMFIVTSIPIMAISFVLGGLNWFALLGFIVMILVVAILVGSIGVFCSSAFKKTIASIVMTFLIEFGVLFLPLIICGGVLGVEAIAYAAVTDQMMNPPDPNFGPTPFIMILTPLTGFFDYMMRVMNLTSIAEILREADMFGVITPILSYAWIPVNVIISGLLSFFFLRMAARKLNPIKKRKKKVPKQMEAQKLQGMPVAPQPQLYQPQMMQGQPQVAQPQPQMTGQPQMQEQVPPQPIYAPPQPAMTSPVQNVEPVQQAAAVPPVQNLEPMQQAAAVPPVQNVEPVQQAGEVPQQTLQE